MATTTLNVTTSHDFTQSPIDALTAKFGCACELIGADGYSVGYKIELPQENAASFAVEATRSGMFVFNR